MSRIGGWTRIGIVLSGVWVLIALGGAAYQTMLVKPIFGEFVFIEFVDSGPAVDMGRYVPVEPRLIPSRVAAVSLIPVIAFWAFSTATWLIVRWVSAGFRR